MDERRPKPPPWGLLISQALKRSGLSARKAAKEAALSEGRWRQITSGYQNVSAGVYAPVRGPAETIARMSRVVGVTPEELEEADRRDAADELRKLPPFDGPPEDEPTLEQLADRVALLERFVVERMTKDERQRFGIDPPDGDQAQSG